MLFSPISLVNPLNHSPEEGRELIGWFNPATFLCLSQARTWISNVIHHGIFFLCFYDVRQKLTKACVAFAVLTCRLKIKLILSYLKWGVIACFVDIGGIVDHHGFKLSFYNPIIHTYSDLYLYSLHLYYIYNSLTPLPRDPHPLCEAVVLCNYCFGIRCRHPGVL